MFTLNNPVKLIFGNGSLEQLSDAAKGLGTKALIVTGRSSARKHGYLQRVSELLKKSGIESVPFERVTPNPLSGTVDEGVNIVKKKPVIWLSVSAEEVQWIQQKPLLSAL